MKSIRYIPGNDWSGERLQLEDEFGNRGEVRFPRLRKRGFGRVNVPDQWEDASVTIRSSMDGDADETAAAAEFALKLAHIAKTLDLACASEREEAVAAAEKQEAERKLRKEVRDKAQQMRCEEVAQYYMQMVRVQREGHSSNAKGELNIRILNEGTEHQSIQLRMWLKESNGNRWDFQADAIAKFEYKDGNRYTEVTFTPMEELERQAKDQLQQQEVAA